MTLMTPRLVFFLFLVTVCVFTTSCAAPSASDGGQTGGEVDDEVCEEMERSVAWEEVSELGFTAAEVSAELLNPAQATPQWFSSTTEAPVELVAPSAGTSISVHVETHQEEAQVVLSAPKSPDGDADGKTFEELDELCRSRLELPVTITVTTSDGSLGETAVGTLYAFAVRDTEVSFALDPSTLSGHLLATPRDATVHTLELHAHVALGDDPGGIIALSYESSSGENATEGRLPVAEW